MTRVSNRLLIAFYSSLILGACSSPKPIFYSNGKDAHILACSGATWSGCLRDAGSICADKGYEILEKSSGREYGFFYDSAVKEMVISCGLPVPQTAPSPVVVDEPAVSPVPPTTSVKLGELGTVVAPNAPAKVQSAPKPTKISPESDSSELLIKQ